MDTKWLGRIGRWSFLGGLVLAFVASIWPEQTWTIWVLAVVGVVVGFLNVSWGEAKTFLLAAIGLSLSARALETLPYVGEAATSIIANAVAFVAAAMLVVAIKVLVATAANE